jgi:hypothetical protein
LMSTPGINGAGAAGSTVSPRRIGWRGPWMILTACRGGTLSSGGLRRALQAVRLARCSPFVCLEAAGCILLWVPSVYARGPPAIVKAVLYVDASVHIHVY